MNQLKCMFLQLNHKSLDFYKVVREMIKEIYFLSNKLPSEEKFNIVQQLRRAAVSVKLNFSEGSTRESLIERKRYYVVSRSSLVELDSTLEIIVDLNYIKSDEMVKAGELTIRYFSMLSKIIEKTK